MKTRKPKAKKKTESAPMSEERIKKLAKKVIDSMKEAPAVYVPVKDLIQWVKNPRDNDKAVDNAMASIEQFGWGAPLVARKANKEIIAGHTRIKAALRLGISKVPVRYMNLTAEEAHAYAVADNKIGELATWNKALLAENLRELPSDRYVLNDEPYGLLGFRDGEASRILMVEDRPSSDPNDDDVPPIAKTPPIAKPGDIWLLGKHRLLCGDCRVASDVARLIGAVKINLAFTSPPYASQRKYDEASGFELIHPDKFVAWFEDVQANVGRHLAEDGSWFVNIKEHVDDGQRSLYVKDLLIAHVRKWGWLWVDEFAWNRPAPPGRWPTRFKNGFEPVFHYSKTKEIKFRPYAVARASENVSVKSSEVGANTAGPNGEHWNLSSETESGFALPSNVINVSGVEKHTGHSAAFPVALPRHFIKAFSDEGDVIFDPFMGSGTTIIACERTNRIGYGTELSPAYCDVIVQRWEKLTGLKARREKSRKAS